MFFWNFFLFIFSFVFLFSQARGIFCFFPEIFLRNFLASQMLLMVHWAISPERNNVMRAVDWEVPDR